MESTENFQWESAVGVAIVVALICSLCIVGVWGTDGYWEFVRGSAPAWIQAFGSVFAVLVAVWVMNQGNRRSAKAAIAHQRAFTAQLSAGLDLAVLVLSSEAGLGPIRMLRDQLLDCLQIGQSIPIAELPARSIWVVGEARQINARIVAMLTDMEGNERNGSLDRRWALRVATQECDRLKEILPELE